MKKILALIMCLCMLPLYVAAEEPWVIGAWTLVSGVSGGERKDAAALINGDGIMVFDADGTFHAYTLRNGQVVEKSEALLWTMTGRLVVMMDGQATATLQGNGMMRMTGMGEEATLRRATEEELAWLSNTADQPATGSTDKERDASVTTQRFEQGVEEPEAGSGWALTPVDMPAYTALHSLSPSGRYAIMELEEHAFALYDLLSGTQTPITYDTARTRSVQDDHQSLEGLEKAGLLYYTGHVAWSPDERYAAVVNMGSTAMIQPYTDLYVLDTETGMVFMPAAWGKDTEMNGNGFGAVVAVTFAPDGTLYALVQESGEVGSGDRVYIHGAPYVIYRCSPNTGETVRVRELTDVQPLTEHFFACSSNGDLMLLGSSRTDRSRSIHLIIGAQDPAREKALSLGNHGAPDGLVARASGMTALQWYDPRMQGTDTVTLLDMGKPLPPLATGLVVSASGFVSELPLINSRDRNARAIQQRWRSIGSDVKEGAHMHIQQSTLSPDGSLLLAKTNKGIYVMDTLTRVMAPVSCSVAQKDRPLDIQWGGEYVMIRWMRQSVMLRMRKY
ncbi:MAG: hypothetical protein IKK21_10270 [Clostridia bacterium]|nr:hypothetical protein [Clostridia bacterium]